MAENVIATPWQFRKLILSKKDSKLRLLIDVWPMFAGALVCDSLLHMLPY